MSFLDHYLPALLGALGTLLGAAIVWGATSQRLKECERRVSILEGIVSAHGGDINSISVVMARIEANSLSTNQILTRILEFLNKNSNFTA